MLENSEVTTTVFHYFISDEMLDCKITLDDLSFENLNSFDILIEFSSPIASFRNHDYTWVTVSQVRIANDFSPKVIQLQNGSFIQANCNMGIWEVNAKKPKQLLWRFNPEFAAPITQYSNENNTKKIVSAQTAFNFSKKLALLISSSGAIEISRSPIPFSAVACFTDHCDFDTAENLKIQREFFKEKGIKITKGFFLNHFSKREDNASFEKNSFEIEKWILDGHELCYHSLTQSIRKDKEALYEIENFIPPYNNISVWIDHGFQPYNFSVFQKKGISDSYFSNNLKNKNIHILWNYIDCGTATFEVINQLNPSQFNLKSFWKGVKRKSFKKKISLFIKNCIYHFYADNQLMYDYTRLASSYKFFSKNKSIPSFFELLKKCKPVFIPLFKIILFWNTMKNKIYPLAKYSPIFFEHKIGNEKFVVFQTIELLDLKESLNKKSIDKLISENGLFIGHTYFSVLMDYHDGKFFSSKDEINSKVDINFNYLRKQISKEKLWNPTLSELLGYYKNYQKTYFDIDEKGIIFITEDYNIPYRYFS